MAAENRGGGVDCLGGAETSKAAEGAPKIGRRKSRGSIMESRGAAVGAE